MTQHISSEKARAHWRELLDSVAAGEEIVIERYGRPVAVLAPYRAETTTAGAAREPSPVYEYDAAAREQLKAEIVAQLLEELAITEPARKSWREELDELRASIAAHGGMGFSDDPKVIIEQTRRIRDEIFEAEYAHLYR